eukprot:414415_1
MKEYDRHYSPVFKIKDTNIEFQLQFDRRTKNSVSAYTNYSKIWICLKELPKNIASLSVLFAINLYVIPHENIDEKNIIVNNIAHFTHNKLEAEITTSVLFDIKYLTEPAPLTFTINAKIISLNKSEIKTNLVEEKNEMNMKTESLNNLYITKKLFTYKFKQINENQIETNALCCYQWQLQTNSDGFEHLMKTRKRGYYLNSGVFEYKGLKFCFRFFPFGELPEEKSNESDGKMSIILHLIGNFTQGDEIYKCRIMFTLEFVELRLTHEEICTVVNNKNKSIDNLFEKVTLNELIELKTLTFNFCLMGIVASNWDGQSIIEDTQENEKILTPIIIDERMFNENDTSSIFKWNLPKKEILKLRHANDNYKPMIDVIKSDIFIMHGLRAQIWIYPTGMYFKDKGKCSIIIYLIGLPSKHLIMSYIGITLNNLMLCHKYPVQSGDVFSIVLPTNDLINTAVNNENISFAFYFKLLQAYVWSSKKEIDLNNETKIDKSLIILPIKSYKWEISNKLLSQIKQSTTRSLFCSKRFNIFGYHWMLLLHPKRLNHEDGTYSFLIELHLVNIPKNLQFKTLSIQYSFSIVEANVKRSIVVEFDKNRVSAGCWNNKMLSFDKIKQFDSLTVSCDIQILNVFNSDINDITKTIINNAEEMKEEKMDVVNQPKPHYFEWKIPSQYYLGDISPGNQLSSQVIEFFGTKWLIIFEPRNQKDELDTEVQIRLCMVNMNAKLSVLTVWLKLIVEKLEFVEISAKKLRYGESKTICWSIVNREKIQSMKECLTFGFEMTLINCYDKNEMNVTDQYNFCKIDKIETLN